MVRKKATLYGSVRPLFLLLALVAAAIAASAVTGQIASPQAATKEYVVVEFDRIGHPLFLVTDFALTPDGRILVAEKEGRIRVVQADGEINQELFLDLSDQVWITGEAGLVSIALHPSFGENGYFYVNYTDLSQISRVERYEVSAVNPDVADPASAQLILSMPQPSPVHNGAETVFGPDGYLYIGFGDGGRQDDPSNNAQNGQTLLGAILRIDVDNPDPGKAYGIPSDNPFVGDDQVLDEIWAMGLRNPWRFSFDSLNGDMYIGDVGGDRYEEINYEEAPSAGGFNYGWRCYEGHVEAIVDGCLARENYDFPIYVLAHREIDPVPPHVCSVIGGMVHRGDPQSPIYGHYLFGDYCTGTMWAIAKDQSDQWQLNLTTRMPIGYLTSFGQLENGELLVADLGNIYRLIVRNFNAEPMVFLPMMPGKPAP